MTNTGRRRKGFFSRGQFLSTCPAYNATYDSQLSRSMLRVGSWIFDVRAASPFFTLPSPPSLIVIIIVILIVILPLPINAARRYAFAVTGPYHQRPRLLSPLIGDYSCFSTAVRFPYPPPGTARKTSEPFAQQNVNSPVRWYGSFPHISSRCHPPFGGQAPVACCVLRFEI